MEVIVCVKQVPDTAEVAIDPDKGTLIREGVDSIVNPFDKHALEAALQIKKEKGDVHITALTMGPLQAVRALRECLAMGADEAVLLSDRAFAGADTWATSYTLAKAINKIGAFDLIICGKQAIDGDTAQVGPGIAGHLGLPQVTCVQAVREVGENQMVVERAMENGFEVLEVKLPAVITVDKAINEPRLPTLARAMKAHKQQIPNWTARDINAPDNLVGLAGSPTKVKRVFTPGRRGQVQILSAPSDELLCDLLISKLNDDGIFRES